MAPHSSTLAWKIPWMEEPGRLQSMGPWGSDTTGQLHFHFSLSCTGEGNGNPLQCSCLENPRDGGAWWAAVYGVAQSRTWVKRLSSSSSSRGWRNGIWGWVCESFITNPRYPFFTFILSLQLESLAYECLHPRQIAGVFTYDLPARLPRGAGKRLHPPFSSLDSWASWESLFSSILFQSSSPFRHFNACFLYLQLWYLMYKYQLYFPGWIDT